MSTQSGGATWALRVHAACDWVLWSLTMNALWLVFTLAGGVVLGAAPAAVAAADLTRRRLRGELFSTMREFLGVWRREFLRANAVVAPALAVATLLATRAIALITAGAADPASVLVMVAAGFAFTLTATLVPLYVHYDLPLRRYVIVASQWLLRNLAHGVVLLAAGVLIGAASAGLPGLIPLVSIGAWLSLSTALCIAFFTANDTAVAEQIAPVPATAGKAV
ncbi:hypothetical protein MMM2322_02678 [Microbacterium sp. MM2322]